MYDMRMRRGFCLPPELYSAEAHLALQSSYRKAVTAARRDRKNGKQQGLTEEQKQEIRCEDCCVVLLYVHACQVALGQVSHPLTVCCAGKPLIFLTQMAPGQ